MSVFKLYEIHAEYLYGEGTEAKREKQLLALETVGVKETEDRRAIVTADQAMELMQLGYTTGYELTRAQLVYEAPDQVGPAIETFLDKVTEKLFSVAQESFNQRCQQQQPGDSLLRISETMLLEDACTDALQEKLSEGWRIIAAQPQPDQRRPDYILGRPFNPDSDLPTRASRG